MDMKKMLTKMTNLSDGVKSHTTKKSSTITESVKPKTQTRLGSLLKEAEQLTIAPAQQNTQVIKQGQKTLGTVTNPQLAAQLKSAIGKGEMSFNADDLTEEDLDEVAAPGQEKWINANKKRFIDQYGEEKGLSNLYATAWRRHHSVGSSKKVDEGKDEGKPGKNFAKISKSAAKEYGSKEAGERVAGSVRNKLKKANKLEESMELEEADDTFNHILKKFKYEVQKFQTGAHQMDPELFDAVFDYYQHAGKMPYSVARGRGSEETRDWLNDQFESDLMASGIDLVDNPRHFDSHPFAEPDLQFESWDKQLKSLLQEGLTISSSTGNQSGLEDSITVSATGTDADEITAMLRSAGIGHYGGESSDSTTSAYGAPMASDSGSNGFEVEIDSMTPETDAGSMDIRDLFKKFTGMSMSDSGYEEEESSEQTFGQSDYKNSENVTDESDEMIDNTEESEEAENDTEEDENVEEGEEQPCNECGLVETDCECDEEPLEETFANSADDTSTQDTDYMTNTISGGLNKIKTQHKHGYRNGDNPLAMKESDETLSYWKKLSGL